MDLVKWIRNQWDRVLAWVLAAAGALALILGWLGVTDTPYSWEQIPFVISGGLGGIYLLGLGAMLWFSADLRDEWRKLDELVEIEGRIADLLEQAAAPSLSVDSTVIARNGHGSDRSRPRLVASAGAEPGVGSAS